MLDNIIEVNNQKYKLNFNYLNKGLLLSIVSCYKLIEQNNCSFPVFFGTAVYDSGLKIVRCTIRYKDYHNNPYIDIDKEKEDFTRVLNIVKKEMLEYNNKEE